MIFIYQLDAEPPTCGRVLNPHQLMSQKIYSTKPAQWVKQSVPQAIRIRELWGFYPLKPEVM